MKSTIVLIGPIGAGKTAVGRLLAQKLGVGFCSVDEVREGYYGEMGYDEALASRIAASGEGIWGVLRYAEVFDARMVERVLADYGGGVIDFGASNSVYDDKGLLVQVEEVLRPFPNVVLLLPSADTAESNRILRERLIGMLTAAGRGFSEELFELNRYFIEHRSNWRLAKRVVFTEGKTVGEICDEVVGGLER
jgi:hypothetical protein